MKEKLRLLQDFLRDDTQDQLKNLELKLRNSELTTVIILPASLFFKMDLLYELVLKVPSLGLLILGGVHVRSESCAEEGSWFGQGRSR